MRTSDIETVYKIGKKIKEFGQTREARFWGKNQLHKWMKNKNDILLVAEGDEKIVGFIMSQIHPPTKKVIIENACVESGQRRQGIGSRLMKECLRRLQNNDAKYICGMVSLKNKSGIKFVKSLNFRKWDNFTWFEK